MQLDKFRFVLLIADEQAESGHCIRPNFDENGINRVQVSCFGCKKFC